MVLLIYNTKPTRLHYTIVLFIIPMKQANKFMYNTSITLCDYYASIVPFLEPLSKVAATFWLYSQQMRNPSSTLSWIRGYLLNFPAKCLRF